MFDVLIFDIMYSQKLCIDEEDTNFAFHDSN